MGKRVRKPGSPRQKEGREGRVLKTFTNYHVKPKPPKREPNSATTYRLLA